MWRQLTSYGGKLMVRQRYEAQPGSETYDDADIIISGNGVTLSWVNPDGSRRQPGRWELKGACGAGRLVLVGGPAVCVIVSGVIRCSGASFSKS